MTVTPPTCMRCSATATRENPMDRLTLHFDNDHMESQRGDLCRACSVALVRWLDLPADVRTARTAKQQFQATAPRVRRSTVSAPQATVVEEDAISYGNLDEVDAKELIRQIDSLLAGENGISYDWASDSLEGIRETVHTSGHATREQQQAVENIEEGGIRGARRGRY